MWKRITRPYGLGEGLEAEGGLGGLGKAGKGSGSRDNCPGKKRPPLGLWEKIHQTIMKRSTDQEEYVYCVYSEPHVHDVIRVLHVVRLLSLSRLATVKIDKTLVTTVTKVNRHFVIFNAVV